MVSNYNKKLHVQRTIGTQFPSLFKIPWIPSYCRLKHLHAKYDIAPIDKAFNNVGVCKAYYVSHCIIFPSSIYCFLLLLWYFQNLLTELCIII